MGVGGGVGVSVGSIGVAIGVDVGGKGVAVGGIGVVVGTGVAVGSASLQPEARTRTIITVIITV
jgi:hypothetical protein